VNSEQGRNEKMKKMKEMKEMMLSGRGIPLTGFKSPCGNGELRMEN
jgi:hypothetical protein